MVDDADWDRPVRVNWGILLKHYAYNCDTPSDIEEGFLNDE